MQKLADFTIVGNSWQLCAQQQSRLMLMTVVITQADVFMTFMTGVGALAIKLNV